MCYNCFIESGLPAIVNEKTIKAAELVTAIYQQEGCEVGGYAHIVVDDWNTELHCIEFCIEEAKKGAYDFISKEGQSACIKCMEFFKQLTEHEIESALAIHSGFILP